MKKSHKIIVALVFIITVLLIIFLSKDFIIRKYFISILENVDYDEYILEVSINGKKSAIYYYTPEYVMERNYDNNGNLDNNIIIYDYIKNSQYQYNTKNFRTTSPIEHFIVEKSNYINNEMILNLLRKEYNKKNFKYKGTQIINNKKCHILEFIDATMITTIYLDKDILYTTKIDTYFSSTKDHTIYEYNLDLTLDKKSLFEFKL